MKIQNTIHSTRGGRPVRLVLVLFCLIPLLFSSCENFLSGGEFRALLEEEVAESTAPEISVRVQLGDNSSGTTFPSGDVTKKKGYAFEVSYESNDKSVYFDKWIVLNEKGETLSDEIVKFESKTEEKTNVTVYTTDKVFIKALSRTKPEITDFQPKSTNGSAPQDSSIIITFNNPMNAEDMTFQNITISDGVHNPNANEYFKNPVLSDDGKTLLIEVDRTKNLIEEDGKALSVSVHISSLTESRENDPWTVEDKTFTYQINSKKDEVPPQLISIELFKDENCTKPLTSKTYSETSWEESDYKQNHVNKVYAKASGKDAGGIFAVNVKEKLLKNTEGNDTVSELHEKTFGAMSFQNTDGVYSSVVEIEFQEAYDGLVNLELSLTDFAGNKSDAVKYDVIKDTMVDVSIIKPVQKAISYKSIQNTTRNLYYDDPSFIRESSENVDVLILQFNTLEEKYFGEHKAELESFEVYYGYANDKYSMTQAEYIAEGNSYKITRDKNKNTYILYSAVDAAGNETEIFRIIPKSERLVNPKKTKDYQDNSGNPENYFEFSVSNYESMKNSYNQMGMSDYGYYCLYQYKDELPKRYRYDLGEFDYKPYTSLKDYSSLTPKFYFSYRGDSPNYTINLSNESTFRPAGDYYVYVIPYSDYGEEKYFSALSDPVVIRVTNNPNALNTAEVINDETKIPENIIPSDFTVSCESGGSSTGTVNITVSLSDDFNFDEQYFYYSCYKNTNNNELSYASFDLQTKTATGVFQNSGNREISVVVMDNEGNTRESTKTETVNLGTIDNIGPVFPSLFSFSTRKAGSIQIDSVNDFPSGVKQNENGKEIISYWFVKFLPDQTEYIQYSEDELKKYEMHIGSVPRLYYDYLEEGFYTLCMMAEDKKDNRTYLYWKIPNIYEKSLEIKYDSDSTKYLVFGQLASGDLAIYANSIGVNGDCWSSAHVGDEEIGGCTPTSTGYSDSWLNKNLCTTGESYKFSEKFVRINMLVKINIDGNNEHISSAFTQIIYPDYYADPSQFPSKVHSLLKSGGNDLEVFSDGPVLVQTFWCSKNLNELPELDYAKALDSKERVKEYAKHWITKAVEIEDSVTVENSSFTYEIPLEKIPAGKWYTTVAYYADGTVKMLEPMMR